jgi:hypothetical protein
MTDMPLNLCRHVVSVAIMAAAMVCAGCDSGPPRGLLAGNVTNKGQAITGARIYFENAELGAGAVIDLDADGRFTVATAEGPGLPPGKYQVAIKPQGKTSATSPPQEIPVEALAGSSAAKDPAPANELIPPKFHDLAESGLQIEIKEGENPDWEIDLGK